MSLREAAEKALEALEYAARCAAMVECSNAAEALRAALAEAEEPVAWFESPYGEVRINPLYKFQFPSSLLSWQIPLFTHPPRREPLTEEQIRALLYDHAFDAITFARAIERAHGIGG